MKPSEQTSNPSASGKFSSDGTLSKAAMGAHGVVDRMAGAADEAARKARPAIDRVAEYAHGAVDKAVDAATPTADWLSQQGETLNRTQKKLLSSTRNYVAENPVKSIGIALACGFIISRLVIRR